MCCLHLSDHSSTLFVISLFEFLSQSTRPYPLQHYARDLILSDARASPACLPLPSLPLLSSSCQRCATTGSFKTAQVNLIISVKSYARERYGNNLDLPVCRSTTDGDAGRPPAHNHTVVLTTQRSNIATSLQPNQNPRVGMADQVTN